MRLYPPVPQFARQAIGPDTIDGAAVPPGSIIAVNIWLTHRHPDHWPDAETFDPERFSPERTEGREKHAYVPFGAGPRICIGSGEPSGQCDR